MGNVLSQKEIANENWKVLITPKSGSIPAGQQSINWMLSKSPKAKVGNGAVLIQQINWMVSPMLCTLPGFPQHSGSTAIVPIVTTAVKTKCDKMPVLRKGDKGSCMCLFVNPQNGASMNASCDFEIIDAGQMGVKGS